MEQEKITTEYPEPVEQTYQTGSHPQPPKSYGGLVAMLFGVVILLCGLTTALSVMNIRMFWELNDPVKQVSEIGLSFSRETPPVATAPVPVFREPECTPPEASLVIETMPSVAMAPPEEWEAPAEPMTLEPEVIPEFPLEAVAQKAAASMARVEFLLPEGSRTQHATILTTNGYLLADSTFLEDAEKILVHLADQRSLEATLIGQDDRLSLAVLHVPAEDLIPATLCDGGRLADGDQVAAFPSGKVANVVQQLPGLLQTDVSVGAGEPLLNRFGQVVGVSVGPLGLSQELTESLGFAVPCTTLKETVETIIRSYEPEEDPSLGVNLEDIPLFYQLYYELPQGLYITGVDNASDAFLKGISAGDILVSINGKALESISDIPALIQEFSPGDTVNLVVYRSGEHYELNITLGEEP